MRIQCKLSVGVVNGRSEKPLQGSVAIGSKDREIQMTVCTAKNKSENIFKISSNVERLFSKFISDGKVTIRFKEPHKDVMISTVSVYHR